MTNKKKIIRVGNNFYDLETFFGEIDRVLINGLTWKSSDNMNAYNDLLSGGFSVHEYEKPVKFVWINFKKSERLLGKRLSQNLKEYIRIDRPTNIFLVTIE